MEQGALSPSISVPDTIAELLAAGASVPIGTSGKVRVRGQNNMATSQKLGIHMIIQDPDGITVKDYEDWEFGTTGPDDDHEFIGPGFDIDKPGDWLIGISLSMNPDNPVTVDSYSGLLCRVTEEYAGEIIKMELEYDSVRGDIPVY